MKFQIILLRNSRCRPVYILVLQILMLLQCLQRNAESADLTTQVGELEVSSFQPDSKREVGEKCVPKCCGVNQLLAVTLLDEATCKISVLNTTFDPNVHLAPYMNPTPYMKPLSFTYNSSLQGCGTKLYKYEKFCFYIQEDGHLLYRDHTFNWVKISPENYCVDRYEYDMHHRMPLLGEARNYGFLTRTPLYEFVYSGEQIHVILAAGFSVGSIFLLATFVVYALVWSEQNIQGMITMSHSASMFFWYFLLGWCIFLDPKKPDRYDRPPLCVCFGIIHHFFVLSSFCWLTINSFNLFWTFRTISVPNLNTRPLGQYLTFALFGWGFPFVFVVVSVILDQIYSYDPCNTIVVPEYGFEICFVSLNSFGPYLYYPQIGVMSLNFIFFSMTAYKLYGYNKRSLRGKDSLKNGNELFPMIGKLFFMTGFIWIVEVIAWGCSHFKNGISFSHFVNYISVLQVVPIFLVYISKPSLLKSLKTKYPRLTPIWKVGESCCGWSCTGSGHGGQNPNSAVASTSKGEGRKPVDLLSSNAIELE